MDEKINSQLSRRDLLRYGSPSPRCTALSNTASRRSRDLVQPVTPSQPGVEAAILFF
jgi:hypothetical protein